MHLQLAPHRAIVLHGISAIGRQRLDEMDQHARSLDVPQKLVPQADADALLDQARQIGKNEGPLAADVDDAEVGVLRRERVIGDLGVRPARAGSAASIFPRWADR